MEIQVKTPTNRKTQARPQLPKRLQLRKVSQEPSPDEDFCHDKPSTHDSSHQEDAGKDPSCPEDTTKNLRPSEDSCPDKPSTPRNMVNPKKMKMTQQQRLITTRHPTYQLETDSMQKLSPSEKSYKGSSITKTQAKTPLIKQIPPRAPALMNTPAFTSKKQGDSSQQFDLYKTKAENIKVILSTNPKYKTNE